MKQIKVGESYFDLDFAIQTKEDFKGSIRPVIAVKLLNTAYDLIKASFTDGLVWEIIDGDSTYDHSDFNLIGSIMDNLDGSFTIKIGEKYSETEKLQKSLSESTENLEVLTGKENVTKEDIILIRESIENFYVTSTASVDEKILSMSLCPEWKSGSHVVGEVYKTTQEGVRQIWECIQNYDNDTYPDIVPTDPSWRTFHKPFHGTTLETALEWVAPIGAHDIYKVGEYMLYTDGKIYKCVKDTNFTPEEQSDAWEVAGERSAA